MWCVTVATSMLGFLLLLPLCFHFSMALRHTFNGVRAIIDWLKCQPDYTRLVQLLRLLFLLWRLSLWLTVSRWDVNQTEMQCSFVGKQQQKKLWQIFLAENPLNSPSRDKLYSAHTTTLPIHLILAFPYTRINIRVDALDDALITCLWAQMGHCKSFFEKKENSSKKDSSVDTEWTAL